MDVLNPQLVWIGSRCYRVNIPNDNRASEHKHANYDQEEDFSCEFDGKYRKYSINKANFIISLVISGDDDFFEIETIDNGKKFQLKVHVPQLLHAQIIGMKGTTKKRIEQGIHIKTFTINSMV